MLKRTILNSSHRRLNAKLVDFGGWEMPLHYGSQLAEHREVRTGAGMFDVSHMLAIDIEGPQSSDCLRYLLANNIDRLRVPGKALYSCMLDAQAGILDDLIVYFVDASRYRLVVNGATADDDLLWISGWCERQFPLAQVNPRRDLAIIAVQGPAARERVWRAFPECRASTVGLGNFFCTQWRDLQIARTGYTGEDGFEILLPAVQAPEAWDKLIQAGVVPAGLGARDTLRLEAGMCLYGQDIDASVTPMESGLHWTVDLQEGRAFCGREALQTARPRTTLLGLILEDRGIMRSHQEVRTAHGSGFVTSGSYSPTLEKSIAIARLPVAARPGESVTIEIRDRQIGARTVKYPFVRNGRSLLTGS